MQPAPEFLMLEPGLRIGLYELVAPAAPGTWQCRAVAGQPSAPGFVVKTVDPEAPPDDIDAVIRLMRRESIIMMMLQAKLRGHPGAWRFARRVAGGMLGARQPYLITERLSGASIPSPRSASAALRIAEIVAIGLGTAEALVLLHDQGIVHADLKPDHVWRTAAGYVLLDFGIARLHGSGPVKPRFNLDADPNSTNSICGTVLYLSPEQAKGQRVTPASDFYQLGVLLYQLTAGRLPFEGDELPVVMGHATRQPDDVADSRPDTPPGLRTLIMSLLRKDPADRPTGLEVIRRLHPAATQAA